MKQIFQMIFLSANLWKSIKSTKHSCINAGKGSLFIGKIFLEFDTAIIFNADLETVFIYLNFRAHFKRSNFFNFYTVAELIKQFALSDTNCAQALYYHLILLSHFIKCLALTFKVIVFKYFISFRVEPAAAPDEQKEEVLTERRKVGSGIFRRRPIGLPEDEEND